MSPLGIPLLSTTMVLIILVTILAWIIVGTVVGLENAEEGCCQTNTCGESAAVQVLKVTSIVSGSVLTLIIVATVVLTVFNAAPRAGAFGTAREMAAKMQEKVRGMGPAMQRLMMRRG